MTALDWKHGELAAGLKCYRERDYFEAHEHWETVWLRSAEPQKTLVQAMIQLAAACLHYDRSNLQGARSLLPAIIRRLDESTGALEDDRRSELREALRIWHDALKTPDAPTNEPSAAIRQLTALDR